MRYRETQGGCDFFASARGSEGETIMTRNFKGSLLIALMLIVAWATTSEACHWRRRSNCGYTQYSCGGYASGSSQGYYGAGGGYGTTGGGYYNQGYQGGYTQPGYYGGQPGAGYDFGRPGYNPGGLGGPASGIGVRPGLGAGGFGPGR
jgi:hypothetical protein